MYDHRCAIWDSVPGKVRATTLSGLGLALMQKEWRIAYRRQVLSAGNPKTPSIQVVLLCCLQSMKYCLLWGTSNLGEVDTGKAKSPSS